MPCAPPNTTFGNWEGSSPGHRPIEAADRGGRRIVIVDRPGSVQSELRIGHVGIARGHADYFPAIVMASLLGGTFSSRLNQRLREELGYTYGARAAFDPRRAAGPFIARAAVHTEVTADAVRETIGLLEGMQAAPPAADELREVTDYLVGVFPLRFETTAGAAAGHRAGRGLWPGPRLVGDVPGPDRGRRAGRGPSRGDHPAPTRRGGDRARRGCGRGPPGARGR